MSFNKKLFTTGGSVSALSNYDALYAFEFSEVDATGNYSMTSGSGSFGYTSNRVFGAYSVDVGSSYKRISMDFTSGGTFETYSVSLWVKFDGIPTNSVHKLLSNGTISTGYVLSIRDDGTNRQIYGGGTYDNFSSNDFPAYDNTNWYHCVVTYDSSTDTVSTYVNGSFSRSYTADGTNLPNASQTTFGRSSYAVVHIPNCLIDQMRVYSRVLDADEISELYNE